MLDLLCVLSRFSHVQLFMTLSIVAHQTLLSMGFSSQESYGEIPCPPPCDLPDWGTEPGSLAVQVDSLPLSHQGSPVFAVQQCKSAICIHIPSLLSPPPTHPQYHPSRSSQNTELSSRCYTAAPHQLSVLHLVVYICQWYSPDLSHISFPYCVHMLTLYCISIYTLQIGSSGPSF